MKWERQRFCLAIKISFANKFFIAKGTRILIERILTNNAWGGQEVERLLIFDDFGRICK